MAATGNLDRTLESIAKDRKSTRNTKPRRAAPARAAKATVATGKASSNGVQKARAGKPTKAVAVAPAKRGGESKIQVSGLPEDVSEAMLKDYFGTAVGPVKKVLVNYGPNGRSRGSATIIFSDGSSAARALELDGVKVDNRTLRVEVLTSSADLLAQVPVKTLGDRISKPKGAAGKEKTKPVATNGKAGAAKGKAEGKTEGKGKKSGRAGRPKAKTVDELDAEMADYFGGPTNGAANGAAQPAAAPATAAADTAMVDEVL